MHINSTSKTTEHFNSTSQNKQAFDTDSSFQSRLLKNIEDIVPVGNISRMKTIKLQEEKCLEIVRCKKISEKMRAKVEERLLKAIEEERKKIKIMMQVLDDISKIFPYYCTPYKWKKKNLDSHPIFFNFINI